MNKKIMIVIVLLLLVGVGVAVYTLVLAPKEDEEVVSNPSEGLYSYSPGEYFVTNIADSERLFKATIVLGLKSQDYEAMAIENNAQIRDIIISTLRQKTEEELLAPDAQDVLREEICQNLREKMKMDYLVTLYYNEFVLS